MLNNRNRKGRGGRGFCNLNLVVGLLLVLLLLVPMGISLVWQPYDTSSMELTNKYALPSLQHWLGTDKMGRDNYARLMEGVRVSFLIGITVVACGGTVGFFLGALAGYFGGAMDAVFQKLIDTLMAFPGILLAMMLIAVFGNGIGNTVLALSIMAVPKFARITRGGYRRLREAEFVRAERIRGAGTARILFLHILPNLSAELAATASLAFASAVMSEAGLSYLGMGITPPNPSLGNLLSDAQDSILSAPWLVLIPAVCITMLVMGFNQLGDGIQEASEKR